MTTKKPSSGGSADTAMKPGGVVGSSGGHQLDRFIEVPKDLLAKALQQPSVLHHLAVACTKCGRWVPFEITDHIPDVAPLRVPSSSVVLRDAVSADHLPGVLQRRSARLASRMVSQAAGGFQSALLGHNQQQSATTYYMPNPQCFTCNWSYCSDGDADFLELTETIVTSSSNSNGKKKNGGGVSGGGVADGTAAAATRRGNERRAIASATAVAGDTSTRIPLVAQCCLCQKWRRVRRPHPSIIGFCCALSAYAESRSCAVPENIEWLSDIFLSSEKLRGILRRQRRPPRYMDPRHIRESRQLLHRQRVQSAPALFGGLASSSGASAIGKKREDPIDVDRAEVIPVSRIAGATTHVEKEPVGASQRRGRSKRNATDADVVVVVNKDDDATKDGSGRGRHSKPPPDRIIKKEPATVDDAPPPKAAPQRRSGGGRRTAASSSVKMEPVEDVDDLCAVVDPSSFRSARLASRAALRHNEHEAPGGRTDDVVRHTTGSKSSPHLRHRQPVSSVVDDSDEEEEEDDHPPAHKRSRKEPPPAGKSDTTTNRNSRQQQQQPQRRRGTTTVKAEPLTDSEEVEPTTTRHGTTSRHTRIRDAAQAAASSSRSTKASSGASGARSTANKTIWVQCGACEKWRVVLHRPNKEALRVWECAHRVEIPTCCADPDEANMERAMLMRLGII